MGASLQHETSDRPAGNGPADSPPMEYDGAAAMVARRYHLPLRMAAIVAAMAGLGKQHEGSP